MKDFEDTLLEVSWNNLNVENKRFKDIDTKAISIITICGILTTLLINFGISDGISDNTLSQAIFILTALSFLLTVILSISVIKPRKVKSLSTKALIDFFKDKAQETQITGIIATVAEAENILMDINDLKAQELNKSVKLLGVSVILMIVYSLTILI